MFPLFVNGLPRSGTTILMHSLASHPQIVAHESYPYETRYSIWVWHNFKVLSQPPTEKGHHWSFQSHENYAEKNPFYLHQDLREYFKNTYVDFTREIAKEQVDHYYSYLAKKYNKEKPKLFLEKFPGIFEDFLRLQYAQYRSIYILRNPIDVYLSMIRMNRKRGRLDFEVNKFEHPQQHIKSLIKSSVHAVKKYTENDGFKVIKYENFISSPQKILEDIFTFLELDVNEVILSSGEHRVRDRSFSQKHCTSGSANLENAQKELNPLINKEILDFIAKECSNDLNILGYEIDFNKYLKKNKTRIVKVENSKNMTNLTALVEQGIQLKKAGKIDQARENYLQALEINPEYVPALNHLGVIHEINTQIDEAITAYQKVIALSPNNLNAHWRIAPLYSQKGDLDRAIESYQKAIELKPDLPDKVYKDLALAKELRQQVQEENLPLEPLKQNGEIYSNIWKELNQTSLTSLEETIDKYPKEKAIDPKKVSGHFKQTSKYKIINLASLSEGDKQFLESVGLSLTYLKQNDAQVITSEGFAQEKSRDPIDFFALHLSMVEEGYIYSICPSTGKVLKSNRSLPLDYLLGSCSYRFVGKEVFYLILRRQCLFFKNYLYFPRLDLVVLFDRGIPVDKSEQTISSTINFLKTNTVTFWQKFRFYLLRNDEVKKVAVIHNGSVWHYLYNILSAIYKMNEMKYLPKIDFFLLAGSSFYGGLNEIFPEINSAKIKYLQPSKTIYEDVLENNYFAFRVIYHRCEHRERLLKDLIQRVVKISQKKCSASCLREIEEAKDKYFPLLWINSRIHRRMWLSQVEGTANIIKSLYFHFPNLGVVFDGFTRQDIEGKSVINLKEEKIIEEENKLVHQIQSLLPEKVKVYNSIGRFMHESLIWAEAIDLCLETYGSSTTKTGIFKKPKFVHGSNTLMKTKRIDGVTDVNEEDIQTDYDFDWKIAYENLFNLASELTRD